VTYEVSCQLEQAVKVVQALYDGPHPSAVLEELICRWLQEFARIQKHEGNPFIKGYFHGLKKQAENELKRRAKEEIGLMLDARLSLKNDALIKPIQIHSQFFPVRVKDYSEELSLKIAEAMLQVNEDNKIYIVATNEQVSQLQQLLQQQIGVFLRENATLNEFIYQLNGQLRDKLVTHLNDHFLLNRGRKISYLALDSSKIDSLRPKEESSQFEYNDNAVKVKNCPTPISMAHTVVMNLNDLGKYKAARIDNLETWLEGKLKKITRTILIGKEYAELMLSETGEQIKNQLETEVEFIGYSVKHLVSKPPELIDLEEKGIHFDDSVVECTTKDTRIKSKLSISVKAKIGEIDKLKKFLNPHKNIVEEVKELIFQEVKQNIRETEPETFYRNFSPVGQRLVEKISKKLLNIGLKEENTPSVVQDKKHDEFFMYFDELVKEPYPYEVTFPILEENEEFPKLTGSFRILDVDWTGELGWEEFQRHVISHTLPEILNIITKTFEDNIRAHLKTVDVQIIRQEKGGDFLVGITKEIQKWLNQSMKQFGLVGRIVNVPLSLTPGDELSDEERQSDYRIGQEKIKTEEETAKVFLEESKKQVKLLAEEQTNNIIHNDDDPAVMNTDKKLERLVGQKQPFSRRIGSKIKGKTCSKSKQDSYEKRLAYWKKKNQSLSSEQDREQLEKDTKEEDNK